MKDRNTMKESTSATHEMEFVKFCWSNGICGNESKWLVPWRTVRDIAPQLLERLRQGKTTLTDDERALFQPPQPAPKWFPVSELPPQTTIETSEFYGCATQAE